MVVLSFIISYYFILFQKINNLYDLQSFNDLQSFIWANRSIIFVAPILEEIVFRGFLMNYFKEPSSKRKNLIRRFSLIFFIISLLFSLPELLMNYLVPLTDNYGKNKAELSHSLSFIHDTVSNLSSNYVFFNFRFFTSNQYLEKLNELFNGHLELYFVPFVTSLVIFISFSNYKIQTFCVKIRDLLISRHKILEKIYYIISYPFIDFWVNKNNRFMYAISTIYFALLHLKWYSINNFNLYYNTNYVLISNLHILIVFILALFALWLRVRINLISAIALHSLYNTITVLVEVNFISKINNLEYNTYLIGLITLNILIILWFLIHKFLIHKPIDPIKTIT